MENPRYAVRVVVEVPKRVLIVEDDICVQESLKAILARIDHKIKVDCIDRADRAEALIRHGKLYDLVIVDISLAANTNGIDLWKSCHMPYSNLNFLFISSMSAGEFEERLRQAYSHLGDRTSELTFTRIRPMFLSKPFSILEGTEVIQSLISK